MKRPEIEIRAKVEALGGQMARKVGILLAAFGHDELSADNARDIEARLEAVDVGCAPALAGLERSDFVTLYLLDRAGSENSEPPQESPTQQLVREAVQQTTFQAVATGLVAVGAALTVYGITRHLIYGLIFGTLTLLGLGLVRWQLGWLIRLFVPRFPFLRLGWALGGLTMVTVALIGALFIAAPVAAVRDGQARERQAQELVDRASEALNENRLATAERLLDEAEDEDKDVDGLDGARDRLATAYATREEETRNRADYREAEAAMRDDQYRLAISGMERLGDYRDASERARAFRAVAAKELMAEGKAASDTGTALTYARRAHRFGRSAKTKAFLATASTAHAAYKAEQRRIREERQRQRELERQQRELERQQQREYERQQRELELQQEMEQYETPDYDTPDTGGGTGNWCGATRDGDGDGIWCEGR